MVDAKSRSCGRPPEREKEIRRGGGPRRDIFEVLATRDAEIFRDPLSRGPLKQTNKQT